MPSAAQPKVLYFNPATLTQPRLIAEWWIPAAGGISVTQDGRTAESRTFALEQVLLWDPDILIVTAPEDVTRSTPTRLSGSSSRLSTSGCMSPRWGPIRGRIAPPSNR